MSPVISAGALRLIVLVGLFGAGVWVGALANGWRLGEQHNAYRLSQSEALSGAWQLASATAAHYQQLVADLGYRHWRELQAAMRREAALQADLDRADYGLSVRAVCPELPAGAGDGAAGGVGDGAGAELDPAARPDYHALRAQILATEQRVKYLQEYALLCQEQGHGM